MPKAKPEADPGTVSVNVEDFQRTRDSVIVALATLQSSVQDLSRAYINHANTVLSGGSAGLLNIGLTNTLLDTGLVGGQPMRAPSPPAQVEISDGKKKRKRAPHDPNAPKRALTPYFLYMQSARAQIAEELGDNAKPKEVADEGTRRWGAMADEDKSVWNQIYAKNLAIYREKMKAYKAGLPVPTDDEAAKLVESGIVEVDLAAATAVAAVEEETEDSSPEPVKAPSPPKSNKRRKTAEKPATPAKETPAASKKSPEKKKSEKKATPAAAPAKAAAETGKKKKGGKK